MPCFQERSCFIIGVAQAERLTWIYREKTLVISLMTDTGVYKATENIIIAISMFT